MKTVLTLVDFSDVTPRVIEHAEAFANAFGAEIVLCHITPPEPVVVDYAPPVPLKQLESSGPQLEALRDALTMRGVSTRIHSDQGPVSDCILEWSRVNKPEIVIMGSHGHGALYNLLVGSVTAGVVKGATCPVMVVPSLLKSS
jgi:nucleotide-binding universal stress UspA family protein